MQVPEIIRPELVSLPPMYAWPAPLKRVVLLLAAAVCVAAYALLAGGLIGAVVLLAGLAIN